MVCVCCCSYIPRCTFLLKLNEAASCTPVLILRPLCCCIGVCLFPCLYCGRICNARERAQPTRPVVFEIMSFLWCQLCVCCRCRHARCAHTKVLKSKVGVTLSPMCGCGGGRVCFFAVAARHNNVGTVYDSLCHAIERNRRALIAQRWTLSRSLNSPFNCFVFAHEGCIKSFKWHREKPIVITSKETVNFVRRKSKLFVCLFCAMSLRLLSFEWRWWFSMERECFDLIETFKKECWENIRRNGIS